MKIKHKKRGSVRKLYSNLCHIAFLRKITKQVQDKKNLFFEGKKWGVVIWGVFYFAKKGSTSYVAVCFSRLKIITTERFLGLLKQTATCKVLIRRNRIINLFTVRQNSSFQIIQIIKVS